MSKHRHQSKEEQINNRLQTAARSNYDITASLRSKPAALKKTQSKTSSGNDPVRTLAYEIYQKKGGSALDNWVEAEEMLKNSKGDV